MLGLGFTEILFLAVLALVVIGPKQLPEVARTLGRFLNELKRASNEITNDFKNNIRLDDPPQNLPPHYQNVDVINNLNEQMPPVDPHTDDTQEQPKTPPKSGEET